MSPFLQQAEDILEVAVQGNDDGEDVIILFDRAGGMRMVDSSGWSLPALSAEFGADTVFRVERRAGAVRVEGLAGVDQRCLIQRGRHLAPVVPARSLPVALITGSWENVSNMVDDEGFDQIVCRQPEPAWLLQRPEKIAALSLTA